jgi:outer membrane immunogenic protein
MWHSLKHSVARTIPSPIVAAGLTALVVVLANSANAADLPIAMKAPPPVPGFSWTGFYVGADVGYAWGKDSTSEYFTGTNTFTGFKWNYNANSFVGGLYAGGNYQSGNFVLGLESDIEAAGNRGGFFDPPGSGDTRVDWQGSFRGRAGFAFDKALFYGTGGLAFANISHTYTNLITGISETTAGVRTGWTAGGGVEVALTHNILARAEYRYTDFGSYRYDSILSFPGLTGEQRPRFDTVRVGVAYKF